MTHEWPAGIGTTRSAPCGSEDIALLTMLKRPALHVCGHMHHRLSTTLDRIRVEALAEMRAGRDAVIVVRWTQGGPVVCEPPADGRTSPG